MRAAKFYWAWSEEMLGAENCGPLTSLDTRSELVRAIMGLAWLQVEGANLNWAGDLVSFYFFIKTEYRTRRRNKDSPSQW